MNHRTRLCQRRRATQLWPVLLLPIFLFGAACGEPRLGGSPPEAVFTGRSTVAPGTTILFDSSLSMDANGLIDSRMFDFGDGSPAVVMFSPHAEHLYEDAGEFEVTLTIKDDLGNTGSVTHNVLIVEGWQGCDATVDCNTRDSHCVKQECEILPPGVASDLD